MDTSERLVIVGAGCAGVELAFSARAMGWTGSITLVSDEPEVPYHRPPLSKAYLLGEATAESLSLRAPALYESQAVRLLQGVRVLAIDRHSRTVRLSDGVTLDYGKLVLATGGYPRPLPAATAGAADARNFRYLRTFADAEAIRESLVAGKRLVIIGGGYVGLEVAAAAVKRGLTVTLLEAADRVLARVTAPLLSEFYEKVHRAEGVDIRTGEQVSGFKLSDDGHAVTAVACANGAVFEADLVVAGIGLVPNCELAALAGLTVGNGIVVDEQLRTSDPSIYAAGDCVCYPSPLYERPIRIESVPSALEQARRIAAQLCGKAPRPDAAPWFWSDQYDLALKMVGLSDGYDQLILRGSPDLKSFSAFYVKGSRVLAVDTVNRAVEFNHAKQLVLERLSVAPNRLSDDSIPLKTIIDEARAQLAASRS